MPTYFLMVHILISLACLLAWLRLRRKRKNQLISAVALTVAAISFWGTLLSEIEIRSVTFEWVGSALYVFFMGVIIFAVFRRYFPSDVAASEDYSSPAALRNAVTNILDSEAFLTALRSTLPRGANDEQYGLDYIPFMLHSIDERRKRATRAARLFLLSTVTAAVIFSAIVMYFGYILVNEAGAGSAKSLADLRNNTERISDALPSLIPTFSNPKFQQDVAAPLYKLTQVDPGPKNKALQAQISFAIEQARNTGNFVSLNETLQTARQAVANGVGPERNYRTAVGEAADKLAAFVNAQSSALPEIQNRTGELKTLIATAESTLAKPENRTPEIIKRLALSIVISTFFLALLRYLGTLYRTRYLQVLEAEKDDFTVRRFYVALKSSLASDEARKAVLANFMAGTNGASGAKDSSEDSKQEFEVIKELVQTLSKKL